MHAPLSLFNSNHCHGRETEKKALNEYFDKSQTAGIYVTVQGKAGSGKKKLVTSKPWEKGAGESSTFFVSTTFCQAQSSQAFSAITQGMNDLCEEWANAPNGVEQMQEFCSNESQDDEILQQFLPSLFSIGKSRTLRPFHDSVGGSVLSAPSFQVPTDHWRGFERLRTLLYKLLRFMSREQSKVIVFLFNDLQWADANSVELIGFLVDENIPGLLLISTYQTEDVEAPLLEPLHQQHAVIEHLHQLHLSERAEGRVFSMALEDFTIDELNSIFAKLTQRPPEETLPLVQVIRDKTGGNPLFVEQFLKLLQRQGLLTFSFATLQWDWKKPSEIRQATSIVSNEVAEMVASCMRKLNQQVQEVLKLASCLGSRFPVLLLQQYFRLNDVFIRVEDALHELALNDIIQKGGNNDDVSAEFYQFTHHKIQEAADSLFDGAEDRDEMRLELGKLLLNMINHDGPATSPELCGLRRDYLVYLAVDQLNRVPSILLFEAGENMRVDLAELNLQAAKMSISKSAFYPAISLLRSGIDLLKAGKNRSLLKPAKSVELARQANSLMQSSTGSSRSSLPLMSPVRGSRPKFSTANPEDESPAELLMASFTMLELSVNYHGMDMWVDQYKLSLELYNNLLEMEYTVGHQEEARTAIDLVLEKAKTQEDEFRARACLLEIIANGKDRDFRGGAEMCVEILKTYGVNLSMKLNKLQVGLEKRRLRKSLPNGRLEDLMHMSLMKDQRAIYTSLFLGKLSFFAAMALEPNFTKLVSLRSFYLSSSHGINAYTALAMASYGFAFSKENENGEAIKCGELSYELLKRSTSSVPGPMYARILCMIHCSMTPLKRPFPDLLEPFTRVYSVGIKTGDVEFAMTGAMCYGYVYLMVGLPLLPLEGDMKAYGQESRQFAVTPSVQVQFPIFQQTIINLRYKSPNPTELRGFAMNEEDLLEQVEGNGSAMTMRDIAIFRLMLAYVFRDVHTGRQMLEDLSKYPLFNPNVARSYMRQVFTGLVAFMLYKKTGVRTFLRTGNAALDFFKDAVRHSSINAYPLLTLLQAEKNPSKQGYDDAIRICSRSGLPNFAAMANESAALHFLREGDKEYGSFYISRAIALYNDWGANAKVALLAQEFPNCSWHQEQYSENGGPITKNSVKGRSQYRASLAIGTKNLALTGHDMGNLTHDTASQQHDVLADKKNVCSTTKTLSLRSGRSSSRCSFSSQ